MTKWDKKGIIFDPSVLFPWAALGAMAPTPLVLKDRIRIFAGMRDIAGIGRVGWVDVALNDPTKVLQWADVPVLDIGLPGAFDDNGVIPVALVQDGGALYLFYAGYQLHSKVRFTIFSGMAISLNEGLSFKKYSNTPIMDRKDDEYLFRFIQYILYDKNKWKIWYAGGGTFTQGTEKTLPNYDIRYIESDSMTDFSSMGTVVMPAGEGEYRTGRPAIFRQGDAYIMYFGASTEEASYRLAAATSLDGIHWHRNDLLLNISINEEDFDSKMSAYPAVVHYQHKTYLFYTGNEFGRHGIGLAISTDE